MIIEEKESVTCFELVEYIQENVNISVKNIPNRTKNCTKLFLFLYYSKENNALT